MRVKEQGSRSGSETSFAGVIYARIYPFNGIRCRGGV